MELDLLQFVRAASKDQIQAVADVFYNGSWKYLKYHVAKGRKKVPAENVRELSSFILALGYNVPPHKIRPDVFRGVV